MEKEIFDFNIEEMEIFHCQLSPASDPGNENNLILLNEDELTTKIDEVDQILHSTMTENPPWLFDAKSVPTKPNAQSHLVESRADNFQKLEQKRLFDHYTKLALKSVLPDLSENEIHGYTEFFHRAISKVEIANKN